MRVLVTGAAGFICGYVIPELLAAGHEVVGVDNLATYGRPRRAFEADPGYRFVVGDATDSDLLRGLAADCDQIVAAAGLVGGSTSFAELAYDLLATNERIIAATFDAAIDACLDGHLDRIVVLSSSLVYESAAIFPTPEGTQLVSPPPLSTFGFQKLASEYFAKGAWEQYRLPYTILRLSNVVGIGAPVGLGITPGVAGLRHPDAGELRLAMNNTVQDLALQAIEGHDPLHIRGSGGQIRPFTHAADAARGIRLAMEADAGRNNDFNISTAEATSVLDLAERIWRRVHGDGRPFHVVSDEPAAYDVPIRTPDVRKARALLGFTATTTLDEMIDEAIAWIRAELAAGDIDADGRPRTPAGSIAG
ncbi:MAG TPA: NAD(P)-dependent oxidoreductase [Candidatus Limnocylindrales bacterium]|nr:NAD(P)-dependent oxidoreductase [Candidatus Limnocylindrales bacterium]